MADAEDQGHRVAEVSLRARVLVALGGAGAEGGGTAIPPSCSTRSSPWAQRSPGPPDGQARLTEGSARLTEDVRQLVAAQGRTVTASGGEDRLGWLDAEDVRSAAARARLLERVTRAPVLAPRWPAGG